MGIMDLNGHVAVIIDAGSEIGRSCANALSTRKAKVLVNVPKDNQGDGNGQTVTAYSNSAKAIQHALSQHGQVDSVLFITPTYEDHDTFNGDHNRAWSAMRSDALDGAFQCTKAVWAIFRQQRRGRVVFANVPEKPTIASTASAFSLLGFAQTLSREGAKYNIACNVVMGEAPLFTTGIGDSANPTDLVPTATALIPMLLDTSNSQHSGALFQISRNGASKFRWERARGALLNPEERFTPGALASRWPKVNDFADKSYPEASADFQSILAQTLSLPGNSPKMEPRFDGKVAIVTGASSGLGRCYALALASLGASILVNDLNDPTPTVENIISAGGKAVGCQDSCEEGDTIVAAAVTAFGGVDILINNAGFLRDKAFVNMDIETWNAVLNVHLNGTYQMTQAAWPYLAKSGNGVVVNTSSTSGIYGVFGQANYSTGKLGILGLSEAFAREGMKHGIRVNTIAPVATTGALAAAWANADDKNKGVAMKPEYNVPAVLLLCSNSVNGHRNTISGMLFEIGCGWHAATRLRPVSGYTNLHVSNLTPESVLHDWKPLSTSALADIELRKGIEVANNDYEYTERDVILYNLSVGASRSDLSLVYEGSSGFQALPTFGIIPFFSEQVIFHHAELLPNFDIKKSFLGEHILEIFESPIPTSGRFRSTGRVLEVVDKGKAAIVRTGYTTYDANTGRKLFYNEVVFFAGGAGELGGPKDPTKSREPVKKQSLPNRAADVLVQHATSPEQAALYRLNGDYEALHIDPETSRRAGLELPILHGHCTMSIAGKHIFQKFGRIRKIQARFVSTVVPGDTLKIEMWKEKTCVMYRVSVGETGKVCISDSYASLFQDEKSIAHQKLIMDSKTRVVA